MIFRPAYGIALGDCFLLSGIAVFLNLPLVPCRSKYLKSVSDLYANHPGIRVARDCDDETFDPRWRAFGFSGGEQTIIEWYDRFGVPFSERWDSCPIPAITDSIKPGPFNHVFVHDDAERGFNIPVEGYRPRMTESIFHHVPAIKSAVKIHCMNSSFFNLIESMTRPNADLFYYPNIKQAYNLPMRHDWKVIL
jgi:hypothetical protein